jgi:O-antigen/teichoic acid export membrane protein
MRQVRLAAAMLAILTVLVTVLFWFIPDIDINVIASGAIAAAALIIVAPFEALDRAARERVIAACITYVAAIGVSLCFTLQTPVEQAPIGALAMLAASGLVLAAWSFKIQNRRRRSVWSNYFDR